MPTANMVPSSTLPMTPSPSSGREIKQTYWNNEGVSTETLAHDLTNSSRTTVVNEISHGDCRRRIDSYWRRGAGDVDRSYVVKTALVKHS